MGDVSMITAFQHMLYITMMAVCIIVLPALVIGLIVAVFQAATQVNEMTLSFLPKMVVILLLIATFAPWLIQQLVNYMHALVESIPYLVK
jgi:flagellar biosynthetic protein FliQ